MNGVLQQAFAHMFGTKEKKLARESDPDTSKEAAQSVSTADLERIVYNVILAAENGCTADDVEKALPYLRSHSITPRFAPLIRKGLIYDTGERRRASSGRNQRVVKATPLDTPQ